MATGASLKTKWTSGVYPTPAMFDELVSSAVTPIGRLFNETLNPGLVYVSSENSISTKPVTVLGRQLIAKSSDEQAIMLNVGGREGVAKADTEVSAGVGITGGGVFTAPTIDIDLETLASAGTYAFTDITTNDRGYVTNVLNSVGATGVYQATVTIGSVNSLAISLGGGTYNAVYIACCSVMVSGDASDYGIRLGTANSYRHRTRSETGTITDGARTKHELVVPILGSGATTSDAQADCYMRNSSLWIISGTAFNGTAKAGNKVVQSLSSTASGKVGSVSILTSSNRNFTKGTVVVRAFNYASI